MLSVLIIQDTLSRKEELCSMLFEHKYVVSFAQNREHALAILSEDTYRFQAIILDYSLNDDIDLFVKQLRLNYQYQSFPVILYGDNPAPREGLLQLTESKDLINIHAILENYLHSKSNLYNIGEISEAVFYYKTIEQANLLAKALASQYPKSEQMVVGISELLINAVEHGNLEITYKDKTELLSTNSWFAEIERRLNDSGYSKRRVTVHFKRTEESIKLSIADEGKGFNWREFEQLDPRRFLATHGRGIMMARSLSFHSVTYNETGSSVFTEFFLHEKI
jgi:anti-sigma regulatory factor (Ser/Thr protein kinase)